MRKQRGLRGWRAALGWAAAGTVLLALAQSSVTTTVLHEFDSGSNAARGGVTLGPDGNYYGTFANGGAHGEGGIFQLAVNPLSGSKTYAVVYSFSALSAGKNTDGAAPSGSLALAPDGSRFYGVTAQGGPNGQGTLFSVTLPSSSSPTPSFAVLGNFGASSLASGFITGYPDGQIVVGSDGTIYGAALDGLNANGQIWSYHNGTFGDLHDFGPQNSSGTGNGDGSQPRGLVLGPDGKLWGVATSGGANGSGTVFNLTTAGAFTLVYTYSSAPANSGGYPVNHDGNEPLALTPLNDGSGLYVITSYGGSNGLGALDFVPISGAGGLTVLGSLPGKDSSGNYPGGATPAGAVQVAADGSIIETFSYGGSGSNGAVSQIVLPSPANPSAVLTLNPLYSFTGLNGSGVNADGAIPTGPSLFLTLGPGFNSAAGFRAEEHPAVASRAAIELPWAGTRAQGRAAMSCAPPALRGGLVIDTREGVSTGLGSVFAIALGLSLPEYVEFSEHAISVAPGTTYTLSWTSQCVNACWLSSVGPLGISLLSQSVPPVGSTFETMSDTARPGSSFGWIIECDDEAEDFVQVTVAGSSSSSSSSGGGSSSGSSSSSSGGSSSSSGGSSSGGGGAFGLPLLAALATMAHRRRRSVRRGFG